MFVHRDHRNRSGNVLVLTALMMVGMVGVMALAVDIGYIQVIRSELQRTADATALAAASDLIDTDLTGAGGDPEARMELAQATALQFAGLNPVGRSSPTVAPQDLQFGYIADPSAPDATMDTSDPSQFNAVRVIVRRNEQLNGMVPLFFARVLGFAEWSGQCEATAMFLNSLSGVKPPADGCDLELLPFALDQVTWNDMLGGTGTDDWTWDPLNEQVVAGSDDVLEVNLFPQGTGSPGNRGTVDIGSSNNSANDIARQIVDGISTDDLDYHGGSLEFDANGEIELNGDTGISAGVKDELESIKGDPRMIPIFSAVAGPGNNAQYTIVDFVGIRIMEVKLTGKMSRKRVIVQPACIDSLGIVPPVGDEKGQFVRSPVWLIR